MDARAYSKQVDLEDCADMYITAARNSSLTGQFLQIGMYGMPLSPLII